MVERNQLVKENKETKGKVEEVFDKFTLKLEAYPKLCKNFVIDFCFYLSSYRIS